MAQKRNQLQQCIFFAVICMQYYKIRYLFGTLFLLFHFRFPFFFYSYYVYACIGRCTLFCLVRSLKSGLCDMYIYNSKLENAVLSRT